MARGYLVERSFNMSEHNRLVTDLSPEINVWKELKLIDASVLGGSFFVWMGIQSIIPTLMFKVITFLVFMSLAFLAIYRPSRNAGRRNYSVFLISLKRDREVYHSIYKTELFHNHPELRKLDESKKTLNLSTLEEY